ncbi:uncharacterized protein LOC115629672 [Scaptodrosophila lebanonensis]|uniref:Uncharacterized protein LOC115629672 n=1 Tax=Drosophila lebanonensis TaxID=7225 RepID=A0A6J2U2D3_DROLE|nr:uncharacterized protein LOC115629672 [Scaptodrosophila lebanonensis]
MAAALNGDQRNGETDNISALELQSNRRVLYCSDGTMEESSDSEPEADVPDKSYNVHIDERELPLGPRLRYKACRMGNNILAGIDYVGGGLASFLGITNSKYASELDHYKRAKEHGDANETDEDLDNWQTGRGGGRVGNNNIHSTDRNEAPIVVCEPARSREEGLGLTRPPSRQ